MASCPVGKVDWNLTESVLGSVQGFDAFHEKGVAVIANPVGEQGLKRDGRERS
jgi:hypothetical protein